MAQALAEYPDVLYFYDYPAADTAAVITLTVRTEGRIWAIEDIVFGYDTAPAAAKELVISAGGTDVVKIPVTTEEGKRFIPVGGLKRAITEEVVITLAADTGGAKGYLFVQVRPEFRGPPA